MHAFFVSAQNAAYTMTFWAALQDAIERMPDEETIIAEENRPRDLPKPIRAGQFRKAPVPKAMPDSIYRWLSMGSRKRGGGGMGMRTHASVTNLLHETSCIAGASMATDHRPHGTATVIANCTAVGKHGCNAKRLLGPL
jgi:hypothetical protein